MTHSKFTVDDPAFERCTRQVIQPNHITRVREEEEVLEADVDAQFFQIPPGLPAPQEEQEEQAGDAQENSSVLKCIMEDSRDPLHAFQEGELYLFGVNSGSDSDVPEDELTDEMEDTSSDEDRQVPVSLQEKEGPTEEDHGLPSPGNIPVDDTIAVEKNTEPSAVNRLNVTQVNVQGTEPEDPSIPRHLDGMEDIVALEEGQLVPVLNSQEAKHFTEGDHDKPSPVIIPVEYQCSEEDPMNLQEEEDPSFQGDRDQLSPGSVPLEDIIAIQEDQLDPVNLQVKEDPTEEDHDLPTPGIIPVEKLSSEEDHLIPVKFQVEEDPTKGDHDQPSCPGSIPLEDITALEGNEAGPVNLHLTLVNVQVTEPEDPNTSRRVDFNITTIDRLVCREADQGVMVIPEIQLDVKVETVTTTSAAEGESSSSSRILMDIHVDPKPPESAEDSYGLLHETVVNGDVDSPDLKDVNETPLKRTCI